MTDTHITALLNELQGSLPFVRQKAAECLIAIGEPAVPGLIASLSDDHPPSVQYVAAEALGRIRTPEALAAIEQWRMKHL